MAQTAVKTPVMLNSWKEIAAFLDRGVRTVQRWEKDLDLPVHRIGKGKRSPVYALASELKFWVATSDVNATARGQALERKLLPIAGGNNGRATTAIETSHRLMAESLALVRTIAETTALQKRQAEVLQKRILEMKSRLK